MSEAADTLKLNQEDPICLDDNCRGELDTGWECIKCGKDWMDWYYPKHERLPKEPEIQP